MFTLEEMLASDNQSIINWKKKFLQHFPNISIPGGEQEWHELFVSTYNVLYESLSPLAKVIFSLVKEGSIHRLELIDSCLAIVGAEKDSNGESIFVWIHQYKKTH